MYRIVGADQKEYGPVTVDQLREWIAQGRANGQTIVRFEDGAWKPLSTFPEFAGSFPTAPFSPQGIPPLAGRSSQFAYPSQVCGAAVAGLAFSILGILCCGPFGFTLGLVCSIIGYTQINANPGKYSTSKGVAIAGIVLALVGFAMIALFIVTGAMDTVFKYLKRF